MVGAWKERRFTDRSSQKSLSVVDPSDARPAAGVSLANHATKQKRPRHIIDIQSRTATSSSVAPVAKQAAVGDGGFRRS